MDVLQRYFPGLQWLQGYRGSTLASDLMSGITIAAMLIPQSMGYALVAGLPVEYGLYACIVPPIMYALLGTSNKLSIGPVALDSISVPYTHLTLPTNREVLSSVGPVSFTKKTTLLTFAYCIQKHISTHQPN